MSLQIRQFLPSTIIQFQVAFYQSQSIEGAVDSFLRVQALLPAHNPLAPIFEEVKSAVKAGTPLPEAFRLTGFNSGNRALSSFFSAIAQIAEYGGDFERQIADTLDEALRQNAMLDQEFAALVLLRREPLARSLLHARIPLPPSGFVSLSFVGGVLYGFYRYSRIKALTQSALFAGMQGLIGVLLLPFLLLVKTDIEIRAWRKEFAHFLASTASLLTTGTELTSSMRLVLGHDRNPSVRWQELSYFVEELQRTNERGKLEQLARWLYDRHPLPETLVFLQTVLIARLESHAARRILQQLARQMRGIH